MLRLKTQAAWVAFALVGVAGVDPARAQHITIDGSLSPAQTLVGPSYAIGANLGKQVGGNLFQSFGLFGLSAGEKAVFSGPPNVANVIGRVTGGSPSSINGQVQSTIAGANVFLINPSGIVFGPGGTVNVSGSFHAATADYLKMSDGSRFQATTASGSTLSAAAPTAFGFLNAAPGAITVNGATLAAPNGQTLGLVGGQVSIAGGTVKAPAGTLHVTGVAGVGEVPVDPRNAAALTVTGFAPVSITQNSLLDAGNLTGLNGVGSVFVRAGAMTVDASAIAADIDTGTAGPISIKADSLSVANGGMISGSTVGAANAGPVTIGAGTLTLASGGGIFSNTKGTGSAGPIAVDTGNLTLGNAGLISSASFGAGNAGSVGVTAATGSISGGGEIASLTFGPGRAGDVSVNIAGALTVDGLSTTQTMPSGIFSQALFGNTGNAGHVAVTAGKLTVVNGGVISTSTFGTGNAGQVNVVASDLRVADRGVILSDTFAAGNAGQVSVSAGNLDMIAGGEIASTTQAAGKAGSVSVNASGDLTVDGTGAVQTFPTGIFALALFGVTGDAGTVSVSAGNLSVVNGGAISTSTFGTGNAGRLDVAAGSLSLANAGTISSSTFGTGSAGHVNVTAGSLSVATGGGIATSSFGSGTGGDLTVGSTLIDLSGPGSQISATSGGSGAAGSIMVSARRLTISDGAAITTSAATANGGNIDVSVDDFLYLVNSEITTSVLGASGNGGNITTGSPLLVLDHSRIVAQAVAGHGGNITITASNFVSSPDSIVSASSQLGISGTVELVGPRVDLNGSLVVLSSELRGAAEVLRDKCAARGGRKLSRLVNAGRGGLPQDTETTIPALYIADRDVFPAPGKTARSLSRSGGVPVTAKLSMSCE